ncbi:MAG: ABC transporter permease [Phycisphaerales bacterium JB037]
MTALRALLRLGPTNPIAVRLIQSGSRRTRHLYLRSAYLGLLIVVLLWALLINTEAGDLDYRRLAAAGAASFTWIAYLQIALICILAPVFMAGAIAQEANPRTWDILLTTPLGSGQIVLGHLLGRLYFVLALLVAGLPLFALTQYFGGVPGGSILASTGVAACAAVLVGAIAVALSVSRVAGRRAVFAFYVGVVSYLAITFAADRIIQAQSAPGVTWLTACNPFLALHALLSPSSYPRGVPGDAWWIRHPVAAWCFGSLAISLALMTVSAISARAGGFGQAMSRTSGRAWYRRLFGLGAAGAQHRPPRSVWTNPIAWREAAARNATLGRMLLRWSFIAAGGIFGIALLFLLHGGSMSPASFRVALMATIWGEVLVVTLVAVNMSATAVAREREDGTLDLLLTTPITPADYLSGKLRGLVAYLLPMLAVPLGTMALASAYVASGGLGRAELVRVTETVGTEQVDLPLLLPETAITLPLVTLAFVALAAMIGLSWSLKSKGSIGSVVSTIGIVGIIALTVGLCGWKAGADIGVAGPVAAGMSPATLVFAGIYPAEAIASTVRDTGLGTARLALVAGAVVACVIQIGGVWLLLSAMVRGFDTTVRQLAGTR